MPYFSYHSTAKKLIAEGHLIKYEIVEDWNGIRPALVLYFDDHRPMPIRESRWAEYTGLLGIIAGNEEERGSDWQRESDGGCQP
ncbi:MAG: thermostable hemolysin delta-VPH [Eubacteriales bacterium]|nr:thermostable hemolysin delta-VPH [Eubacteriales bacterium]